jgi:hypothetical protein
VGSNRRSQGCILKIMDPWIHMRGHLVMGKGCIQWVQIGLEFTSLSLKVMVPIPSWILVYRSGQLWQCHNAAATSQYRVIIFPHITSVYICVTYGSICRCLKARSSINLHGTPIYIRHVHRLRLPTWLGIDAHMYI